MIFYPFFIVLLFLENSNYLYIRPLYFSHSSLIIYSFFFLFVFYLEYFLLYLLLLISSPECLISINSIQGIFHLRTIFTLAFKILHLKIQLAFSIFMYVSLKISSNSLGVSLIAQLVKNPPAMRRPGFNLQVGKIPWRRERVPTPVFWPGESHGLYSPWGPKESDTTEWLSLSLAFIYVSVTDFLPSLTPI